MYLQRQKPLGSFVPSDALVLSQDGLDFIYCVSQVAMCEIWLIYSDWGEKSILNDASFKIDNSSYMRMIISIICCITFEPKNGCNWCGNANFIKQTCVGYMNWIGYLMEKWNQLFFIISDIFSFTRRLEDLDMERVTFLLCIVLLATESDVKEMWCMLYGFTWQTFVRINGRQVTWCAMIDRVAVSASSTTAVFIVENSAKLLFFCEEA